MAFEKTLACGEDTDPTTARGCEEGAVVRPIEVDNPFGSF